MSKSCTPPQVHNVNPVPDQTLRFQFSTTKRQTTNVNRPPSRDDNPEKQPTQPNNRTSEHRADVSSRPLPVHLPFSSVGPLRAAPFMSKVPDAWEDEWSTTADTSTSTAGPQAGPEEKKPTTKQTKAQKRAAQAEFNKQLWAEAEGPRQTNYFLESRNVVPLRQEFKPPTVLLSRKGPITQKSRRPPTDGLSNLSLNNDTATSIANREESSEDEDELVAQQRSLAERQAQAARDREEKQKKYEERRLELFGPQNTPSSSSPSNHDRNGDESSSTRNTNNNNTTNRGSHHAFHRPNSRSEGSSPASLTPPGSRSSTPHRGGGGRVNRAGGGAGRRGQHHHQSYAVHGQNQNQSQNPSQPQSRLSAKSAAFTPKSILSHQQDQDQGEDQYHTQSQPQQQIQNANQQSQPQLYDPDSRHFQRREGGDREGKSSRHPLRSRNQSQSQSPLRTGRDIHPVREPRGPDGSGRGGAGFTRKPESLVDVRVGAENGTPDSVSARPS